MYHQQVSGDTEVGEFTDTPEGCTALERDLNRLEKWVILPLLFSTGEVIPAELDAFSTREICMYWKQSKIIKEVEHLKYGESLSKEYSASRRLRGISSLCVRVTCLGDTQRPSGCGQLAPGGPACSWELDQMTSRGPFDFNHSVFLCLGTGS